MCVNLEELTKVLIGKDENAPKLVRSYLMVDPKDKWKEEEKEGEQKV